MKFETIQIEAHWFEEGQLWNVGVNGYNPDDDQPTVVDSFCIGFWLKQSDVAEQLEILAPLYLDEDERHHADTVVILINGSEVTPA